MVNAKVVKRDLISRAVTDHDSDALGALQHDHSRC